MVLVLIVKFEGFQIINQQTTPSPPDKILGLGTAAFYESFYKVKGNNKLHGGANQDIPFKPLILGSRNFFTCYSVLKSH